MKSFKLYSSANVKSSKTQLTKTVQSGGFLGRLLGWLLKTGFPLLKNILKLLPKYILMQLGLAASKEDSRLQNHNIDHFKKKWKI